MRQPVPILAFTPNEHVFQRLNLVWGITPIMCEYVDRLDSLGVRVKHELLERGLVQLGDSIVMTGGHPIAARGATNFVKVLPISD